jgi:hypothetical protein
VLRTSRGPALALVATTLLAAAGTLQAQDLRLTQRLPAGTAAQVQRLVDSAGLEKLPADPLVQKALEGESKGADSTRIVRAVSVLLERLRIGRRELGAQASDAELVAAAAALRAGASTATLRSLRMLRHNQPLVVPLSVLADLMTVGVPAEQAWNAVRDMASSGATDAQFLALRDRMAPAPSSPGNQRLPPTPEHPPASPLPDQPSPRP